MKNKTLIIGLAIVVFLVGIIYFATRFNDHGTFTYPGGELDVLVADNSIEHGRGLSGTEIDTLGADGMIFIFKDQQKRTFWMNGMNYNLDVIWIADDKIFKIDRDVQAPARGEDPAKMQSDPLKADTVLEVPAGVVDELGLVVGHIVGFEQ